MVDHDQVNIWHQCFADCTSSKLKILSALIKELCGMNFYKLTMAKTVQLQASKRDHFMLSTQLYLNRTKLWGLTPMDLGKSPS
jgi:hypothetical protein